jgi:hypothetical protein
MNFEKSTIQSAVNVYEFGLRTEHIGYEYAAGGGVGSEHRVHRVLALSAF